MVASEEDVPAKPSTTRHLLSTYFLFKDVIDRNQLKYGGFSSFTANIMTELVYQCTTFVSLPLPKSTLERRRFLSPQEEDNLSNEGFDTLVISSIS